MSLKTISPAEARDLMNQGAVLVDIRDADEHAREHIPGATHLPLSEIKPGRPELESSQGCSAAKVTAATLRPCTRSAP
jgi:rhodanese-related sulfurtransferase